MHDSRKKVLPKAYDIILWYAKNRESDYTYQSLQERRPEPVKILVQRLHHHV